MTPAPFASSVYGKVVHQRIAGALRSKKPIDLSSIPLPARVMLNDGDDLETLNGRAMDSLCYWKEKCLPWLEGLELCAIEHRTAWHLEHCGQEVRFSGVLDLIVSTPQGELIVDWKTGSLFGAQEQLRFYLALRQKEMGCEGLRAEAISLSSNEVEGVCWYSDCTAWLLEQIDDMLTVLEAIEDHPNKVAPGPHCRYCPYAHDCPENGTGSRTLLNTRTGELAVLC